MAKGYWIARVDVIDAEAYKNYIQANGEAFAKFGGRFLVRGGESESVEGSSRVRNVVIEFPSYRAAQECYRSPEYQRAMAFRREAAESDLVIIEGYEGAQPGNA